MLVVEFKVFMQMQLRFVNNLRKFNIIIVVLSGLQLSVSVVSIL
jgi:hypothetical protein